MADAGPQQIGLRTLPTPFWSQHHHNTPWIPLAPTERVTTPTELFACSSANDTNLLNDSFSTRRALMTRFVECFDDRFRRAAPMTAGLTTASATPSLQHFNTAQNIHAVARQHSKRGPCGPLFI